jgi:hypothetical protein
LIVQLLLSVGALGAALAGNWSYHLLDNAGGGLCLDGTPGAFDFLPAKTPPSGARPPPYCQLARIPSPGHSSYSYFIKTGGDPGVISGFNPLYDKCCCMSANDCHWFVNVDNATTLSACTSFLHLESCLSCGNVSSSLGCPDWDSPPAPGYKEANVSWQIHLAGGGWCYNGTDCAARTHMATSAAANTLIKVMYPRAACSAQILRQTLAFLRGIVCRSGTATVDRSQVTDPRRCR